MMLDGGLNSLKVTVHYQLMHKQMLQTSVQANKFINFPFQKAIAEV